MNRKVSARRPRKNGFRVRGFGITAARGRSLVGRMTSRTAAPPRRASSPRAKREIARRLRKRRYLIREVRRAAEPASQRHLPVRRPKRGKLAGRERDIAIWVARGWNDERIARELGSTRNSVALFRSRKGIYRDPKKRALAEARAAQEAAREEARASKEAARTARSELYDQLVENPLAKLTEHRRLFRQRRGERVGALRFFALVRSLGFARDPEQGPDGGPTPLRATPRGRAEASIFVPVAQSARPTGHTDPPVVLDNRLTDPAVANANVCLTLGLEAGLTPTLDLTDEDLVLVLAGTTKRVAAFLKAALEAQASPDVVMVGPEGVVYLRERFGEDVHIDVDEDLAAETTRGVLA